MKDRIVYLKTAIDCIARIQEYTQGYNLEDFLSDRKTQDAVIRNLEIIGQALKDYGLDNLTEMDATTPWHKVASLRNILAHEYLGVDLVLLWGTIEMHLGGSSLFRVGNGMKV
ncbi:HepT-like ribonuclease domain-containing protein [Geoalkalibacter halelectricus]|uniref:DUF86 domain-containing protein n=1 Tax=Geoalkalibacter halelectricus TaxID=2847045 RepID=A0ABY5ZM24_9BACT|nr:HepT-like ribonuclease domain-containing protein [Geoalkalibacter halelectricus]MDO3379717.1 DUF86 domain-containing protein [Geoalkalibacter halelectricus]UWZ79673.1 DUF86 domain-containing protein [Geoalkalibacter halelectricus]